jgi:hypothetical protein
VDAEVLLRVAVRPPPDLAEEVGVRERATRVGREHAQQLPLRRREVHGAAAARDGAAGEVDHQIAGLDARLPGRCAPQAGAAELGAYARAELDRAEGLRHVVVGARVEQHGLLLVGVTRREHEHRRRRPGADVAADLRAGHVGEPEIEDDQVRTFGGREVRPLAARRRLENPRAVRLERAADDAAICGSSSMTRTVLGGCMRQISLAAPGPELGETSARPLAATSMRLVRVQAV